VPERALALAALLAVVLTPLSINSACRHRRNVVWRVAVAGGRQAKIGHDAACCCMGER
jgi:hypothetical protein